MKEAIDIRALVEHFTAFPIPLPDKCGLEMIAAERIDQVTKNGISVTHDVAFHDEEELVQSAAAILSKDPLDWPLESWYFDHIMKKPRGQQLAIAGALIAADIDRQHYDV